MSDKRQQTDSATEAKLLDVQQLKRALAALKKKYDQQIDELNTAHEEELTALRAQLIQLKSQLQTPPPPQQNEELANLTKRNEQLERVIQHLRERTEEAKLETKTLRDELESIYSRQDKPQGHTSEQTILQDYYEQALADNKQLTARLEEALDGRIAAENRVQEIQQAQQEKERTLLEESESRFKIAQQHLAKKVKETAVLTEQYHELERQYDEIKLDLDVTKGRIFEAHGSLESLRESLRAADAQVVKWEEKYFRLYDKFQESELRCRELKKVEERFIQMQAMVMGVHFPPLMIEKNPQTEITDT